ncbi:hypothetical protein NUM_50380 [Actinocatenispora comari]|uniref:Uncharacterized protein n=1 Tax=Actinocatenispora comari TaxID=2807577 RepID=A0A8J4EQG2_9ACTN|nr:hypothetical protein NUM_50380 [Actinocatenispora comari]
MAVPAAAAARDLAHRRTRGRHTSGRPYRAARTKIIRPGPPPATELFAPPTTDRPSRTAAPPHRRTAAPPHRRTWRIPVKQ